MQCLALSDIWVDCIVLCVLVASMEQQNVRCATVPVQMARLIPYWDTERYRFCVQTTLHI